MESTDIQEMKYQLASVMSVIGILSKSVLTMNLKYNLLSVKQVDFIQEKLGEFESYVKALRGEFGE